MEVKTFGFALYPLKKLRSFLGRFSEEISLLIVAGFLFIGATTTQTGWLYVVDSFLLGTLILGYILPRANLRNISVTREFAPFAFEEDALEVRIVVKNAGWSARGLVIINEPGLCFLSGEDSRRTFLVETLEAGRSQSFSYQLRCSKRGIYAFPPVVLESSAPLGFFPARRRCAASSRLVVYPVGPHIAPSMIRNYSPFSSVHGCSFALAGQSHDFLGIREHQPGEGTRFVHWPSTARAKKLMVKEFKELTAQGITIFIETTGGANFGEGKESTLEYEIKLAASLVQYTQQRNLQLALIAASGKDLRSLRHPKRLEALEFLASLEDRGEIPAKEVYRRAQEAVIPHSHFFILATSPSIDLQAMADSRERKIPITVVLFMAPSFASSDETPGWEFRDEAYQATCAALRSLMIPVRLVERGDNLARVFEDWSLPAQ